MLKAFGRCGFGVRSGRVSGGGGGLGRSGLRRVGQGRGGLAARFVDSRCSSLIANYVLKNYAAKAVKD